MSRSHVVSLAAAVLLSSSAHAFSEGQFGFSGKDNSCLACHGEKSFPGIEVAFEGGTASACVQEGGTFAIPVVGFGESVMLKLTVLKDDAEAPACPAACDQAACAQTPGPTADCRQMYDVNGVCPTFANVCDQPIAGFNAEIAANKDVPSAEGDGVFEAVDDATRVITNASIAGDLELQDPLVECPPGSMGAGDCDTAEGYMCTQRPGDTTVCARSGDIPIRDASQITHRVPRSLESENAVWEFKYTAPAADVAGETGVQIFIGANVANGNGLADREDKNTNVAFAIAFQNEDGTVRMPDICGACSDGMAPDANGVCPGCGCASARPVRSDGVAGGLALAGLAVLLVGRRRRR